LNKFNQFIDDIEEIVRKYEEESDILRHAKPLLAELLRSPESIPKEAFKSRKDRFADNLIYLPDDKIFSVIASVWLPGQSTPIHDHLTWALIGMHEGEEQETIYRNISGNSNTKAILEQISKKINKKGHITVLGKEGIHRIANNSDMRSSSIHIYGIDLGNTKRHTYNPVTGEIGTFLTGYDSILKIR
jgi:predicted metal-dependent enzyme (double-stranded beta helix superfamily)